MWHYQTYDGRTDSGKTSCGSNPAFNLYLYICDSTWEKGPSRALFQNQVIATAGKSRLLATKCATYLVMKAKCSGVIAVSVHSFLSTAIS